MCTKCQCRKNMGQWVRFQTQWGMHQGMIEDMNDRAVLVRVPRRYAPAGYVNDAVPENPEDRKLDVALAAWGGYGGGYGGGPGYGYGGGRWGRPGYGGWYGGWWWWWLAFAWIFWLAWLW